MKGGVVMDYKTPKRMKKRRQLDALVDTVKLPRARKNSTSAQELLDSDSSEIDEFTIPQVGSRRKNRCCTCQSTFARIGLFVISMACLTTCVGLIWVQWHIRHEIDSLRKQIQTVKKTDQSNAEILNIQAQLAAVNSTVIDGKEKLQSITESIAAIQKGLKNLEDATKTPSPSVVSSQDWVNAQKILKGMTVTMADFGDKQTALVTKTDSLGTRLDKLEASANENPANSVDDGSHSQFEEMLAEGLANLNVTVITRFENISQELKKLGERITALEASPQPEPANNNNSTFEQEKEEIKTLVATLVEEKMASITPAHEAPVLNEVELSTLEEIIRNISKAQEDVVDDIQAQKGTFLAFKQDVLGNFEQLNETILTLDNELEFIAQRFDNVEASIGNISTAMASLKNAQTTQDSVTEGDTENSDVDAETKKVAKPDQPLHIDGINSLEDLKLEYDKWPVNDGGFVSYDFLAEKLNVDKETLSKYDTDTDGLFSEMEIAKALGFGVNRR